jgi:hypothetical protein
MIDNSLKKVLIDTNFIIYCLEKKIDFFSYFQIHGINPLIPEEVIKELKKFSNQGNTKLKKLAILSLEFLKKNDFEKIKLSNKITDKGILELANSDKDLLIATLDKELKEKIKNQKIVIRGNRKLEIA